MASNSYFDLQTIVAEEERVPVRFNTDALKIGYLDPSNDSEDIEEGTRVEIPFWLAEALAKRMMVRMDLPKAFSNKFIQDLNADPNSVCLRDKSSTFYESVLAIVSATSTEEARRLLEKAKDALIKRAPRIMDRAHNSLNQDVSDFTNSLTDLEQQIFESGYNFEKEKMSWRKRDTERFAWTNPANQISGRKRTR